MLLVCRNAFVLLLMSNINCGGAGTYELLPFYKGENTVFDVSPPLMNVSVQHHHITIAQKFQVWPRMNSAGKIGFTLFFFLSYLYVNYFWLPQLSYCM